MSKLSFRRKKDNEYSHIAAGLLPAASVAPKPAVPRTPPPHSPAPSHERPRSALAAAILSSSLTGRTFAIPPAYPRSLSETCLTPSHLSTAPYTRESWSGFHACQQLLLSPGLSEEELDDEEQEYQDEQDEQLSEEEPVYQTIDGREDGPVTEPVYARLSKHTSGVRSVVRQEVDEPDALSRIPPPVCVSEADSKDHAERNTRTPYQKRRLSPERRTPPPDPLEGSPQKTSIRRNPAPYRITSCRGEVKKEDVRLEDLQEANQDCSSRRHCAGCAQLKEVQEENNSLKVTFHLLSVELSRYQTSAATQVDMKSLSPLVACEDHINQQDSLLHTTQEELRTLGKQLKEVVQENQRLHEEVLQSGGVTYQDWCALQQQADLVLKENQVLLEKLEIQQEKYQKQHSQVSRMVRRVEELEGELEGNRKEVQALRSRLEESVSWEDHCSITTRLKRQQQGEQEALLKTECLLKKENSRLQEQNSTLCTDISILQTELQHICLAKRQASGRVCLLKRQMRECVLEGAWSRYLLDEVVSLAERTTQERDQLTQLRVTPPLLLQALVLHEHKQGELLRFLHGTVLLGKLQEKIKGYRKRAQADRGALQGNLKQKELEMEGRCSSYRSHILLLQKLLSDREETLERRLQHSREVEEQLEVVWQAATRENQRMRETLLEVSPSCPSLLEITSSPQTGPDSPSPPPISLLWSPGFDLDQNFQEQNEKHGLDFYS